MIVWISSILFIHSCVVICYPVFGYYEQSCSGSICVTLGGMYVYFSWVYTWGWDAIVQKVCLMYYGKLPTLLQSKAFTWFWDSWLNDALRYLPFGNQIAWFFLCLVRLVAKKGCASLHDLKSMQCHCVGLPSRRGVYFPLLEYQLDSCLAMSTKYSGNNQPIPRGLQVPHLENGNCNANFTKLFWGFND